MNLVRTLFVGMVFNLRNAFFVPRSHIRNEQGKIPKIWRSSKGIQIPDEIELFRIIEQVPELAEGKWIRFFVEYEQGARAADITTFSIIEKPQFSLSDEFHVAEKPAPSEFKGILHLLGKDIWLTNINAANDEEIILLTPSLQNTEVANKDHIVWLLRRKERIFLTKWQLEDPELFPEPSSMKQAVPVLFYGTVTKESLFSPILCRPVKS